MYMTEQAHQVCKTPDRTLTAFEMYNVKTYFKSCFSLMIVSVVSCNTVPCIQIPFEDMLKVDRYTAGVVNIKATDSQYFGGSGRNSFARVAEKFWRLRAKQNRGFAVVFVSLLFSLIFTH